jgi:hypothetical protein
VSRKARLGVETGQEVGLCRRVHQLSDEWGNCFSAPVHDMKAAIRWVRANASAYMLDSDRAAVWGGFEGIADFDAWYPITS